MVTFLHTADLHLGMGITRFNAEIIKKVREGRFQALEKIRTLAKDRKVDFTLVAGDLFDDHAVDADIAQRAFALLESFPTPVFIISGNHDPLLAGSVWDRLPWNNPDSAKICLFRDTRPKEVIPGIILFPCPVFRKTSLADPTQWIADWPKDEGAVRIGMAHGSLKTRDDLPPEDHLIARHAAHDLGLDYLALGHWHSRQAFPGPDGVIRTAYCGVHEPMRFPGNTESRTGWTPYSGKREEFLDTGKGEVLHVSLPAPGAVPVIEPVEVGHLIWAEENYSLQTANDVAQLIDLIASRPASERHLLRLRLEGILDSQGLFHIQQLRKVMDRYLFAELDDAGVHLQPTEEEIRQVAGQGILQRVLSKLQCEAAEGDPKARRVAERAIRALYQIANEVKE